MRILVVSNFYPPYHVGGYELGCRDIVAALRERGHAVTVLTSTYKVSGPEQEGDTFRWLAPTFPADWAASQWEYGRRLTGMEAQNQRAFRRLCRRVRPDVVYFWNLTHVSLSLVFLAQRWSLTTSFFVSDGWLADWRADRWCRFLGQFHPKVPLRRLLWAGLRLGLRTRGLLLPSGPPDTHHVQFCSHYLKQAAQETGLPVEDAQVVHWGVDAGRFPFQESTSPPRRLLYVGQLMRHKGVHTAIEAVRQVTQAIPEAGVTLTLAGGSVDEAYVASLHEQVQSSGLEAVVRFTGSLPREDLPALYHQHDILLFPSAWEEPFAITPLEAMSSGLAVVATTTGGSPEIFEDGVNALTFPKENAEACAAQTIRLLRDERLCRGIQRQGRQTVVERFTFEGMAARVESLLRSAVNGPPASPAGSPAVVTP